MDTIINMKFRAHDSFFIRKGWLSKGLKNIKNDPDVFVRKDINPMDTLGIGANMVKAMRYWLQAVGLTEEPQSGKRSQKITEFGEIIWNNDRYIEEMGTLWLLHYHLAKNISESTAWYYFFNKFRPNEFTREDFLVHMKKYLLENGKEVAESSVEGDYNCILSTYLPRIKTNPNKTNPEDNLDCPLGELGLIDITDRKKRLYRKSSPKKDTLPPLILLAVILNQAKGERSVKISSIQNDGCNAGKVFNLDVIILTNLLYKIELMGHIKVVRTAGLDIINIKTDMTFHDCIKEYYRQINI
ncbi:MAG: DUF4007 family protein [Defluviitaleaceae bacterium]|nr:DUF4007 family protein [Defluviitaleaceae bacterium]